MRWDRTALRGPPTKCLMTYDDGWRYGSSLDYARPKSFTDFAKIRKLASYIFKSPCSEPWLLQQDPDFEFLVLEFPHPATIPPNDKDDDDDDDDKGDGIIDEGTHVPAGFSCVARVNTPRTGMPPDPTEIAMFKYLKRHTSVPVPEIYDCGFIEDGPWYVMMERLPGRVQTEMASFNRLTHAQLMQVEEQKAAHFAEAASLRFNKIGSVSASGEMGPLLQKYCDRCNRAGSTWCGDCPGHFAGPYRSTEKYMRYLVNPREWDWLDAFEELPKEYGDACSRVRGALRAYFAGPGRDVAPFQAPFGISLLCRWRHVLVDPSGPEPRITAYLVLENSHTLPLYNILCRLAPAVVESETQAQKLQWHFIACLRGKLPTRGRETLGHFHGWNNRGLDFLIRYALPDPDDDDTTAQLTYAATILERKVRDSALPALTGTNDRGPDDDGEEDDVMH